MGLVGQEPVGEDRNQPNLLLGKWGEMSPSMSVQDQGIPAPLIQDPDPPSPGGGGAPPSGSSGAGASGRRHKSAKPSRYCKLGEISPCMSVQGQGIPALVMQDSPLPGVGGDRNEPNLLLGTM